MPSGTGRHSGRAEGRVAAKAKLETAGFRSLPGIAKASGKRSLKVCVVTSEILGPVKNGGIGTATSALIDNLAGNGHKVTILYTLVQSGEPECAERHWGHWVETLAARNITLTHLPHQGSYREWLRKSWLVKQHLAEHDYDVVYFNEHHGSGYYTLAAKRAGLAPFKDRIHCVITHGSIEWVFNTNDQRLSKASDLAMIGVERRSVEWADVVIGPSQYLLREYQSYGWTLPTHTYHQPYAFPIGVKRPMRERRTVDELVFFGRLETRKGLWLFCEALDRMGDALRGRTVTFMGRPSDVAGYPSPVFIMNRAEKWPCKVNLLLDYSQEQALAYLSKLGRVAVMPSLADNSPCVVYECMQQQIPFVATSGSGAAVAWGSTYFAPTSLVLNDTTATSTLTVSNAIDLGDVVLGVLDGELLAGAVGIGLGKAEGVGADDADVSEHAAECSLAVVAEVADDVAVDGVAGDDFLIGAAELGGEGDLGAATQDDDGVHIDLLADRFCKAQQGVVADDLIAGAGGAEDLALIGAPDADALVGQGDHLGGVGRIAGPEGELFDREQRLRPDESVTGRQGALDDLAEAVPGSGAVEHDAGAVTARKDDARAADQAAST
ncbi:glycosyltransferase family 4 protein, partial [Aestuariivirga sp.]|uniref:glycosyltransferase family 4 protein n=1 Tax=Aestuariivirga sp. TaxID=2650926 RepID=UPI00301B16C7